MAIVIVIVKAVLFFAWCAVMVPLQIILMMFHRGQGSYVLPHIWQKGTCKIFGLKVIVEGQPLHNKQTVFVCNHISYLDIPVLGSVLKASFIAKREVASWPVFGFLSRMQQTAFISRSRNDAQREKNALSNMLDEGKSLILFAEGTSTGGTTVAPFKSSLFSMTLDDNRHDLMIQPVTLRIEEVNGQMADTQDIRDLYAWHGDMTMPPHLKAFTGSRGAVIRVIFHAPMDPKTFSDRKVMADQCHAAVLSGITAPISSSIVASVMAA
jgi:1-acyl-sn-glycerol-3-phosphate acyltransferase